MHLTRAALAAVLTLTAGGAVGAAPSLASPAADRTSVHAAAPTTKGFPAVVLVDGDVRRPALLTPRALGRLPQQQVTTTYTSSGTSETHAFTGPLLIDVLQRAEPRTSADRKNDLLNVVVRAVATDRYSAAVAWGEIDPGFAGTQVLVALTEDGQRLDRPRLVVPGDARGGRYVSDLVRLKVTNLAR